MRKAVITYGAGLAAICAGAWLTELSGSMLPLALGASAAVLCTVSLVRSLLMRKGTGAIGRK